MEAAGISAANTPNCIAGIGRKAHKKLAGQCRRRKEEEKWTYLGSLLSICRQPALAYGLLGVLRPMLAGLFGVSTAAMSGSHHL